MKGRTIVILLATVAILTLFWAAGSAVASPPRERPRGEGGAVIAAIVGEGINYQGRLTDPTTGNPLHGSYTMRFELYDDATAGTLLWDSGNQSVQVANGLFNIKLNVDQEDFNGQALWLRIGVGGQWLTPRRELLPVPYALSLRPGAEIAGSVSGDEALAVRNDSSTIGSTSVFGWAYATSGQTFGVWGTSRSTAGTGVYGNADATSGTTYGVVGVSGSTSGTGVRGSAIASSGTAYGVYGESASTSGYGVYGKATATSGINWGVHGESASTSGRGVHGRATATSGTTYGGRFTSDSTSGYGVYGHTTATSGTNYGVYGEAASLSGYGVYGEAPLTGVYGEATHTSLGPSAGVFGVSASIAGTGMRGEATATSGETAGVFGLSRSNRGMGVYGSATATSGTTYGVYGEAASPDGNGVHGEAPSRGVFGYATATSGTTYGVYGQSDSTSGQGVYGHASAASGVTYGVRGVSNSTTGRGVYGYASTDSGTTYGVYGLADSPDGHGGYFKNNNDGLALRAESKGPLIEAWDGDPLDRRFRVTNPGNVYADGTFNPGGADLAEMLPAVEGLEPGDVLVIGPDGQLTCSTTPYATNIAGVYSTKPGFVGGSDEDGINPGKVPLAVVGVAPVKVSAENGPIAPGNLLTTSGTPGHAMKATEHKVGTILGKALGKLESGTGVIDVLVILQ